MVNHFTALKWLLALSHISHKLASSCQWREQARPRFCVLEGDGTDGWVQKPWLILRFEFRKWKIENEKETYHQMQLDAPGNAGTWKGSKTICGKVSGGESSGTLAYAYLLDDCFYFNRQSAMCFLRVRRHLICVILSTMFKLWIINNL